MEMNFWRFNVTSHIFWIHDILSENQNLMHVQWGDSVPLSCEADNLLGPFDSFSWTGLCNCFMFSQVEKEEQVISHAAEEQQPTFPTEWGGTTEQQPGEVSGWYHW